MNRRSPLLRLLALLCLAAMCSAQACGVTRGYLCDLSGHTEWTALDHCHAGHNADCHGQTATHLREDHEPGDADGIHEHDAAREDLESLMSQQTHAPTLVAVLLFGFGSEEWQTARVVPEPTARFAGEDTGPPAGVAVARTVVLLI